MLAELQPCQWVGLPWAQKLTMAERRALLDSFVGDGWLAPTPGCVGRYSIGVRGDPAGTALLAS